MENNNNTSAFADNDQNFFKEVVTFAVGQQVEDDTAARLLKTINFTAVAQGANLVVETAQRLPYYAPTIKFTYEAKFKFTQPDGTTHGQEIELEINSNSLGDLFAARGAALNAFQWNLLNGLRQQLENGKPASEVLEVMNQFINKFPRMNNLGL